MRRSAIAIVMAILGAGAVWIHGQTGTPAKLSPQDIHEIEQLAQGYTKGIDLGPEDASWVFAPDGIFVYNNRTVTGPKALKEFYANLRKQNVTRTIRHVLSNFILTMSPEGPKATMYLTTIEAPTTITAVGMYEDTYVKTAAGWRIKRRLYHQDLPAPLAQ